MQFNIYKSGLKILRLPVAGSRTPLSNHLTLQVHTDNPASFNP